MVRVLLQHVFDESMAVSILLYAFFLDSIESGERWDVKFKTRVHFFEAICDYVQLNNELVEEPSGEYKKYHSQKDQSFKDHTANNRANINRH